MLTQAGAGGGAIPVPSGFGWTPPVSVFRDGVGVYSTDYDPSPILVEGDPGVTTFYIDAQAGNNANPGTSASPKKSFFPVTGTRYTKLLLKIRGTFYRASASYIQSAHDNLCVEAWGGAEAILTTENDPLATPWVWTSEGSGTWSAPWPNSVNTPNDVYAGTDVDTQTRLTIVASTAACLATASSYYPDYAGGKQWVHTADGTSPATGHTLYGHNSTAGEYTSTAAYVQRAQFIGIQFRGGSTAFALNGDSAFAKTVEFVDCSFKRANNFGAIHCTGNKQVILYNCTAGYTVFDGFSYSTASGGAGGNVCNAVEINCIARNSGFVASGANQGSTTHFGGKIVRVNGQYFSNADDQVGDVGANTCSWHLGCTFGPRGAVAGDAGIRVGNDANAVKAWLDGCTFDTLTYDIYSNGNSFIYYKNMAAPSANPAGTGTVATY